MLQDAKVTYLLNIWEFIYFVCGLSPPKRHVVWWRNLANVKPKAWPSTF